MTAERSGRVISVFRAVEACGADEQFRRDVERLLEAKWNLA
jgi:hypothetical protein